MPPFRSVKARLGTLPVVGPLLIRLWRIYRDPWFGPIGNRIAATITNRNAVVVQIGANDGSRFDPVTDLIKHRAHWRAVFVEPIPVFFDRLRTYYGDDKRFSFERVAIGENRETRPLWFLRPEARAATTAWQDYFDAAGSFDKEHVLGALADQRELLQGYVDSILVEVITLADLLERQRCKFVDIFVVDAEGHDWKIVRQLNFRKMRPTVILFEHSGISPQEREEALSTLAPFYEVTDMGIDYLCVVRAQEV